jgi:hypothetical protein
LRALKLETFYFAIKILTFYEIVLLKYLLKPYGHSLPVIIDNIFPRRHFSKGHFDIHANLYLLYNPVGQKAFNATSTVKINRRYNSRGVDCTRYSIHGKSKDFPLFI